MIVSVHALFSKNNKIGSKIISWGTKHLVPSIKDTPSHVAVLVNNRWVHESTFLTGVRVISLDKWLEKNTLVAMHHIDYCAYQEIADKYREIQSKKYDFLGIMFLGLKIIKTFFQKRPYKMPKKNKWQDENKYFCCEALGHFTGQYYGMSAPVQILAKINRLLYG